ncbi:MAG: undecaprenyl-diphosphate phosphatase [Planctomycetota bacterium]|nr:undecaprenyl-diphosphate phosphatase [Planctomycetota bacterium]
MDLWELILLAIIQGITEFLPVSSSGHLVAVSSFINIENPQLGDLNIALHFGTLLAICCVYFQQIKKLFSSDRKLLAPLIIASIPAGAVGLTLVILDLEQTLHEPKIAGSMMIVTGLLLWYGRVDEESHDQIETVICWKSALIIGVMQAFAILPGISRSGTTIVTARRLGVPAELAARFSFFLAIPIIGGASLITIYKLLVHTDEKSVELAPQQTTSLYLLLIGVIVSAMVGYLALRWLIRVLEHGNFHRFAIWCIPLGAILLIYSLYG